MKRATQRCSHRRITYKKHSDNCWWVVCLGCGGRGPRKHSRPLALARFRRCGTQFRGQVQHVQYDGSSYAALLQATHIAARMAVGLRV